LARRKKKTETTADDTLGADGILGVNAQKELRAIAERIGNLLHDKEQIAVDLKEVYQEAKDAGFSTAELRKAIALIRKPPDKAKADLIDLYMHAIQGDLFDKAA
jgi:uncharacterized protein (UPF0335 family)